MEANDLESFFLNKDKKRKSKKTYVINPSLLIEQTREAELKKAKKVNEKSQQSQEPKSDLLRKTKEDDEWEEETELDVDISNLRIGMMPQKTDEAKPKIDKTETNADCASEESDSDTNSKKNDKSAHPWGNKVTLKSDVENVPSSEPSQIPKYRPPGMRGDLTKVPMKQTKKAPNITNSNEFPSLSEVVDNDVEDGTWSRVNKNGHSQPAKSSEQVTKKSSQPPKRDAPKVSELVSPVPPSIEKKADKPAVGKYVPPNMRRQNENRYAGLETDSTR